MRLLRDARAALLAAMLPVLAATATAATVPVPPPKSGPVFDLGDGLRGGSRGGRIEMWAIAQHGEGWYALARRATGQPGKWKELPGAKDGAPLPAGREVVLPRAAWKPGKGAMLLACLFPGDRMTKEGRRHVVTRGETLGFPESPWSLAALFYGDGKLNDKLVIDPAARARGLRPGDVVIVPTDLLLACWRPAGEAGPAPERVAASSPPKASAPAPKAPAPSDPAPSAAKPPAPSAPKPKEPKAPAPTAAPAVASAREPKDDDSPISFPAAPSAAAPQERIVLQGSGGLAQEGGGSLAVAHVDEPEDGTATPPHAGAPERAPEESEEPEKPLPPSRDDGDDLSAPERAAPEPQKDDFAVTPGTKSDDGLLTFALDAQGPHAVYRLQRGETLYTHVVLRFTGLLSGKDVNDAAQRLARRSRIENVTAIRVGTPVRIPFDDLLPQFLPAGHPRKVRWQQEQSETARLAKRETRKNLEGVHVVLDAGHGGLDPGAGTTRVWEDDFVYDVACRVGAALKERTRATVHPLVLDRSSEHAPLSRIKRDTDEVLLTTPPYPLEKWSARSAVNLRWVLANDVRRKLVGDGVPEDRIVFVSFHADSLHESARGSMAYYASAQYRSPESGIPAEPGYKGLAEARDDNGFRMGRRDMLKSEGLSRALGETLMAALGDAGLAVHGFAPVRGSIVRSGTWVPAVLKYNQVQAAVLVEACNLNNPDDQKNLRDPAFRQAFAEAMVDGLEDYFDGRQPKATPQRAAR